MGLDMYLTGRKYVKDWAYNYDGDVIPEDTPAKVCAKACGIVNAPVSYLILDLAYWRKANSIHGWFVKNVQGGEDDCREYSVGRDELEALLALVNRVIDGDGKPEDLLPPEGGFFFGSTDIDDGYMQDMVDTKDALTKILNDPSLAGVNFYYQSSW